MIDCEVGCSLLSVARETGVSSEAHELLHEATRQAKVSCRGDEPVYSWAVYTAQQCKSGGSQSEAVWPALWFPSPVLS